MTPERVEAHGGMVGIGSPLAGSVRAMFQVRDEGPIRRLTIDNPAHRNAVPFGQWERLAELIEEFGSSGARVLVVQGAGEHFCAGADVGSTFTPGSVAAGYDVMRHVGRAAEALHAVTKPTIAAVDGVAVGAGMNLALGCDVVVATDRARFSEIFVRRGLTVDFGGTWLLPRRVGMARAKELALTGRVFGADEAERMGIVSRVVPAERLEQEVLALAAELVAGAPLAQRFIKAGLDQAFEMSFGEALAYEGRAQALLLASEDFVEGVTSFIQKRDPRFNGR
jgi:2-(1,2-epoxy-1,2-dihydrophenyl)acetyl-CoA isomerase